jgi:hypothetical protein
MSVRIRTNEELAHDLLDLIDRWQDGRDAIRDPDSIEREFAVLREARVVLAACLEVYVDTVENIFDALIPDEEERWRIIEEHNAD